MKLISGSNFRLIAEPRKDRELSMKTKTIILSTIAILAAAAVPVLADGMPEDPVPPNAAAPAGDCTDVTRKSHRTGMHHGGQHMHEQMMAAHRGDTQHMPGHQQMQGMQGHAPQAQPGSTDCDAAKQQSHRTGMRHGGQQMHDQMMADHRQGMQQPGHQPMQNPGTQGQAPQGQPGMNMDGGCKGNGCGNKSQPAQPMPMPMPMKHM
jgi:hypothetical protein